MIQAVIFDCYGVLVTDGWLPFRDKYLGGSPELMKEARDINVRVNSGLMTYDDFIEWAAKVAQKSFADTKRLIENNAVNEQLFEYIRDTLSSQYQVGLLSNAVSGVIDTLFEPWQRDLFDQVLLSHELGVVKPHQAMYETIAMRLGVLPEEAVFIDDRIEFVSGAHAVGMHAIHYQGFDEMKTDLEALLHA